MDQPPSTNDYSNFSRLDMDSDPEQSIMSPAANQYETIYVTSHKGPCRAGAFSPDSRLIATGSADASIKILDVDRMISKSISTHSQHNDAGQDNQPDNVHNQDSNGPDGGYSEPNQPHNHPVQSNSHNTAHPVIRTLYDHSEEVTFVQFHPTAPILASGSLDMTIKFYDYMRPNVKRAHKTIQEASEVRCFAFHPGGSHMLVGCEQPTLRLYDCNTMQSYVSANPLDQHQAPITSMNFYPNASFYVTGSKDGDIKIWDGVSNRCVNTFKRAHEGAVASVKVSRSGKYILSAGKDSHIKLWEISMCSPLITYEGATSSSTKNHRAQACFNHTEDYVLFPDCRNIHLHSWVARTGKRLDNLPLCHNNSVRFLTHSETSPAFLTCSEDYRARFWSVKDATSRIDG